MAKKNLFKNTLAALKPAKNDRFFIQVKDKLVYLSEGHAAARLDIYIYNEYFAGAAVGGVALPYFDTIEVVEEQFTIDNKKMTKGGINLVQVFDNFESKFETTLSSFIFELSEDLTGRGIIYNDCGMAKGIMINEKFAAAIKEFMHLTKKIKVIDSKSPVIIEHKDNAFLALPINFSKHGSDFQEILDTLNAEMTLKVRIKELEKKNAKLESALMEYKETETTERIKSNYKRGLITFSEAAECIADETKTA